jgi:hypothetical protein
MPSRPSDAPGFNAADNGSPATASAAMSSRLGWGLQANPGGPESRETQGRPESSTDPTSRNGSWAKNAMLVGNEGADAVPPGALHPLGETEAFMHGAFALMPGRRRLLAFRAIRGLKVDWQGTRGIAPAEQLAICNDDLIGTK